MRIESLTGLRFIAALGVLVCHFQILLPLDAPLQLIANIGGDGVLLFFCLSGLVITLSLSQHRDTSLSSYRKNSLRHYFYARVARILPIYWLSVLATLVFIASYGLKSSLYAQVSPESTLEVFFRLELIYSHYRLGFIQYLFSNSGMHLPGVCQQKSFLCNCAFCIF